MALSEQQIAQLWTSQGGDAKYATMMAKIAKRESGGKADINNRGLNKNGTVDWGLFQVNDIWRKDPVVGPLFKTGQILTPEGGTKAAIRILGVQGPKAWATYNPSVDQKFIGRGALGGAVAKQPAPGTPATQSTPGVDNSALRAQAVQSFLGSKNSDPVSFAMAIRGAQDVPGTTASAAAAPAVGGPVSSGGAPTSKLVSRANAIDAKRLPYKWGGGHGGKTNAYQATPLDCSGAVSAVLGINPRVSGQFESFGKPGDGGNQGVTIAANGHHVLMKIDGHWFGTSGSNPGGGAGWIKQDQISPQYLKGFTLRHA